MVSRLYAPCRSACERYQNWIKRSKKVTSELWKSKNQECMAANWPLTCKNFKHTFCLVKNLDLGHKLMLQQATYKTTPCIYWNTFNMWWAMRLGTCFQYSKSVFRLKSQLYNYWHTFVIKFCHVTLVWPTVFLSLNLFRDGSSDASFPPCSRQQHPQARLPYEILLWNRTSHCEPKGLF